MTLGLLLFSALYNEFMIISIVYFHLVVVVIDDIFQSQLIDVYRSVCIGSTRHTVVKYPKAF